MSFLNAVVLGSPASQWVYQGQGRCRWFDQGQVFGKYIGCVSRHPFCPLNDNYIRVVSVEVWRRSSHLIEKYTATNMHCHCICCTRHQIFIYETRIVVPISYNHIEHGKDWKEKVHEKPCSRFPVWVLSKYSVWAVAISWKLSYNNARKSKIFVHTYKTHTKSVTEINAPDEKYNRDKLLICETEKNSLQHRTKTYLSAGTIYFIIVVSQP